MATLHGGAYNDVLIGNKAAFAKGHPVFGEHPVFGDGGHPGNGRGAADEAMGPAKAKGEPFDIYGHEGDDLIIGGRGGDKLVGGADDDRIKGRHGDDRIFGDDEEDGEEFSGGGGNDRLDGGHGDDLIAGGAGDDVIRGGHGDDTLIGGAGEDRLSGGHGADVFVFDSGCGEDVVLDFEQGQDLLQIARNINGLQVESADDLATRVADVQGNAVVDLGNGDTITLVGINAEDVQQNPNAFFVVA